MEPSVSERLPRYGYIFGAKELKSLGNYLSAIHRKHPVEDLC